MRLILLGTEQPHLQVLEAVRAGRLRLGEVVVIGQPRWRAPAMLPGLLAGEYVDHDVTVDVAALARAAAARMVEVEADTFDAVARTVTLPGGAVEGGDVLSVALPLRPAMPAAGPGQVRSVAWGDVEALIAALDTPPAIPGSGLSVTVIGAGSTGFEAACALASHAGRAGRTLSIRVVDADGGILADREPAARRLATRALLTRKVGLALGARVESLTARGLLLASGASVPSDLVVWCTGAAPPPALASSGLALDPRGFAEVDGTLRSTSHPAVFVPGRPGLMHEGDLLAHNLAVATGTLPGKSYRTHRAPARAAALLHAGRGSAIVSYGAIAREAGWASRLKDRLDRRLVDRFRQAGT